MKQFIDSLIASVFFLILMLLGETLQFLPSGSSAFLPCVYGTELFFVSWVLMYRSKNTVELLDFFVSAVILGVQFLILGGRLDFDQWCYLSFATIASTISFGCNRRFGNRIHLENRRPQPGNH